MTGQFSIKINDLFYFYKDHLDQNYVALKGVNISLESRFVTAFLGPTGSGKTTLMRLLKGDLIPTTGSIKIVKNDQEFLAQIGYVDQFTYKIFEFAQTLSEIISFYFDNRNIGLELVEEFKLTTALNTPLNKLSFGESQRLAILLSVAKDPSILLFDEITAQLDNKNVAIILEIIKLLKSQGKMVIIATHDKRMHEFCDEVVQLDDGYIENLQNISELNVWDTIPIQQGGLIKIPRHIVRDVWQNPINLFQKFTNKFELILKKGDIDGTNDIQFPKEQFLKLDHQFEIEINDLAIRTPNDRNLAIPSKFSIKSGQITGIFGNSGSGKSTLLDFIFSSLERKFIAQASVKKTNLSKSKIVYLSQQISILDDWGINMILKLLLQNTSHEMFYQICKYLQVEVISSRKLSEYSGGQQHIIMIAIALSRNPSLIVMDETLSNLDREKTEIIIDLLYWLKSTGRGIVIATHDHKIQEICDSHIHIL